ncbi:MAG: hypothetical protein QM664_06730 [Flavihumibacter sp.]
MQRPYKSKQFGYFLAFMAVIAVLRIVNAAQLTPLSNFTPIGAMALFGGARIRGWLGYVFPIGSLLISDLVINTVVFGGKYGIMYSGFYWIYLTMAAIVAIGYFFIKKTAVLPLLAGGIAAGLLFWLIVDFNVWAGGGMDIRTGRPLSRDAAGLLQCYLQGWPYVRNFLAGTLVYSAVLFGADYLLNRHTVKPALINRS